MKTDIKSRADIERIVQHFYHELLRDEGMNFYFGEAFRAKLPDHLSRMCDYWENSLFHTGNYQGNPMISHQHLHQQKKLEPEHFMNWLKCFHASIDSLYEGFMADQLKLRSRNIGYLMQARVLNQPPDEAAYEAMLPNIAPPPTTGTKQ
ncbi:MAG: group III truncated hemoglobin [Bacteroidia bacterium]|jgi:hemoglobin